MEEDHYMRKWHMRNWIVAAAGVAVLNFAGLSQADDSVDVDFETVGYTEAAYDFDSFTDKVDIAAVSCDGCSDGGGVGGCETGCGSCGGCGDTAFSLSGWLDGGFIGNTSSPNSKFNGPYNAVDRSNEGMFNQAYLIAEKGLSDFGCGIGGRLDLLYGEDYLLAESAGIERRDDGSPHWNPQYYGLAIPQAYISLGNSNLNFQVGHFYSVVGYEGVMAPDNFFYSKSYSYQFAGPFTHWGGQMNWQLNNAWTVNFGVHNGWDAFDRESDDAGVIGKVRYDDRGSDFWTSFAITSGKEFNNLANLDIQTEYTNRTRYSWLVGVPVCCQWEYVFHHWLGFQQHGNAAGGQANWYGIDQYLYYTINRCWKAGVRFEWFRDEDGTRVGLNRPSNPNAAPFAGNFFSVSAGVNWSPTDNFILRPELRADWYNGGAAVQPFDDGDDDAQFTLGLDGIVRF